MNIPYVPDEYLICAHQRAIGRLRVVRSHRSAALDRANGVVARLADGARVLEARLEQLLPS